MTAQSRRRAVRTWIATATAGVLALGLAAQPPLEPVAAAAPAVDTPVGNKTPGIGAPRMWSVTLVTGHRVLVTEDDQGRYDAADATLGGGADLGITSVDDHLYVVPLGLQGLVGPVLDPALFDVRELIAEGLDDAHAGQVPVVVSQEGAESAGRLEASTGGAVDARRVLPRLGLVTGTVVKDRASRLRGEFSARAGRRSASGTAQGIGGVSRMWLSRTYRASWDPNLEQIGAPAAWAAGADGTGTKLAVLDTGIDATHPDLAGKVVAGQDFSGKGNIVDGYGHGTHVAALAAGTGAGNDGARKGVAPGASLLVGKVLGDNGSGRADQILAGMEWAVAQGADVVNMSLGGGATDGSDPLSQAVDRLTAQGTLFVISAGNAGPNAETVGSPGAADAALTVAAAAADDTIASFSSRGPRRGDKALKPDASAPGVAIVAARAAGTSMGTPVDDRYTAASGTSMAAPQVAGAAAVLLQRHPDWTPDQVKAVLAGTADPVPGVSPLVQGAGRIDVAEALAATVLPEDEDADLGTLTWPQPERSTATVGWLNEGPAEVRLNLGLDVRGPDGVPLPADTVWLSSTSVTVPAGGRAQVEVDVNAQRTTASQSYAGYLTATVAGTDQQLQIPVGFYDEREAYDLTVRGVDRDGSPAAGSAAWVMNVDDRTLFPVKPVTFDANGLSRLRVPPGNYYVTSTMEQARNADPVNGSYGAEIDSVSRVTAPEVRVGAATSVTLDARTSVPSSFRIEGADTVSSGAVLSEERFDATGRSLETSWTTYGETPVYVPRVLPAVRVGSLTTAAARRMVPRQAELRVSGPHHQQLHVTPAQAPTLPEWTGRRLRPVDVGPGTQAAFDAADVKGRLAVVRRGLPLVEVAERAKAAGATMLAVTNNRPGLFRGPYITPLAIPAIVVDGNGAGELRAAAARHHTVTFTSRPYADTTYDLVATGTGQHVAVKTFTRADIGQLARVDAHYPFGGGVPSSGMLRFIRGNGASVALDSWDAIGRARRTEYLMPGYNVHSILLWGLPGPALSAIEMVANEWTPKRSERVAETWLGAPLSTSIGSVSRFPIVRRGDELDVIMSGLADGDGHAGELLGLAGRENVSGSMELYRGDALVAQVPRLAVSLPLAAEPARYKLVITHGISGALTPLRTRTVDSWEFDSAPVADGQPVTLPLPEIRYQLPLDDTGRLDERTIGVAVRPQVWPSLKAPPTSAVTARQLRVWFSIDDGGTWQSLALGSVRDGVTSLKLPNLPRGTKLSLRSEVVTDQGVRHVRTVIGAVRTD